MSFYRKLALCLTAAQRFCISCCKAEALSLELSPAALMMCLEKTSGTAICGKAIKMHTASLKAVLTW